jgi:hypothetical protein
MLGKSWEFWAVLLGMAVYVATRDAETESLSKRVSKTLASGLLAFGLAPTIAPWVRDNEIAAAVVVMAFGLIILDLVTALILDRDFIKELIRKRLGGGEM